MNDTLQALKDWNSYYLNRESYTDEESEIIRKQLLERFKEADPIKLPT